MSSSPLEEVMVPTLVSTSITPVTKQSSLAEGFNVQ